jgi:hypothetical protein
MNFIFDMSDEESGQILSICCESDFEVEDLERKIICCEERGWYVTLCL